MGMLSRAQNSSAANTVIGIDSGLYNALDAIAKMREIDVEKLIELQLTGFVRSYERSQVLKPDDIMPYGKYKGYAISDIIKGDPRYVAYLLANSANFRLDSTSIELMESLQTDETPGA